MPTILPIFRITREVHNVFRGVARDGKSAVKLVNSTYTLDRLHSTKGWRRVNHINRQEQAVHGGRGQQADFPGRVEVRYERRR